MLWSGAVFLDRCHRSIFIHMAGAGTVPELTRRIFGVRALRFLVRPGFIVAGVASGAVGLKCRELPVHELGVGLVTVGAIEISAVVLRFVGQTDVTIVGGRPCIGDMADIAVFHGIEMGRVLTGREDPVVAGRTGAKNLIVIDGYDWRPE